MIEFKVILYICILNTIKAGVLTNNSASIPNRRILRGSEVGDTRPYMVYLRQARSDETQITDKNWLCGGVIIHERHILTSAACIEDIKNFYVVSGTKTWTPSDHETECIKNGAKKAVSKCIPKSYFYDGNEFDNIRWLSNDLAVVKVDSDFNFERRVKGCDYIPKKIAYNNQSAELEKAAQVASIAGWGSTDAFGDLMTRSSRNSPLLLETDVILISKKNCKKRWDQRYHHIIDEDMICAKDGKDADTICSEQEVNCKDLVYSEEEEDSEKPSRKTIVDPGLLTVHSASHNESRRAKTTSGGFCENDHGGPLVVGQGASAVVIGVISACQTREISGKCFGPFLYSSVWKNRHLLSCSINADTGETCRRLLKSMKSELIVTSFDWNSYAGRTSKSNATNMKQYVPNVFKTIMATKPS